MVLKTKPTEADGLGLMGSTVVFVFLGLLFIVPGIYLVMMEHNKSEETCEKRVQVLGVILVALGCIIGIGVGVSFLKV